MDDEEPPVLVDASEARHIQDEQATNGEETDVKRVPITIVTGRGAHCVDILGARFILRV